MRVGFRSISISCYPQTTQMKQIWVHFFSNKISRLASLFPHFLRLSWDRGFRKIVLNSERLSLVSLKLCGLVIHKISCRHEKSQYVIVRVLSCTTLLPLTWQRWYTTLNASDVKAVTSSYCKGLQDQLPHSFSFTNDSLEQLPTSFNKEFTCNLLKRTPQKKNIS